MNNNCNNCPRECGIDREASLGFCGCGKKIKVARAALHFWEEPCISGINGSGTVFFSGCTLRCCYCQNYLISSEGFGKEISVERLSEIFLELQTKGAHNINLVTATQYISDVLRALDMVKTKLQIPVVYNCGGYERVETIRTLKGYVDIYLPDFKYNSNDLAKKYSGADNYFEIATEAIKEMIDQTDGMVYDKNNTLQKGVIIRHMVLPGARNDSIAILNWINEFLPRGKYLLSLMSQYTPTIKSCEHKEINRKITTFEYNSVVNEAIRLGLTNCFIQQRSSANIDYTPLFDFEGI
ncbi:MAG: radical SAM protein [Clostridiales bacterium GWF2_36_10]|nr:MAG: radical SAM protein [Clostridiales bacterium GWF2_36_10]